MTTFAIETNWRDQVLHDAPEISATIAEISISINGVTVTKNTTGKGSRDFLLVPGYPVAEWFVCNWWALFHEQHQQRIGYDLRHLLSNASDGFVLPHVRFSPKGSMIEIIYSPSHSFDIKFQIPSFNQISDIQTVIKEFVHVVLQRLHENRICETLLEREWIAIQSADSEEKEFAICAGRLGLSPYSLEDHEADILELVDGLPEELREDFLSCSDIDSLESHIREYHGTEMAIANSHPLEQLVFNYPTTPSFQKTAPPWAQGYWAARVLRKVATLPDGPLSHDDILHHMGIRNPETLFIETRLWDRRLQAVSGYNRDHFPVFAVPERDSSKGKFTFCRALGNSFFHSMEPDGFHPQLITQFNTDKQKRNRAFAAELLAPSECIRRELRSGVVDQDDIGEIADKFGVQPLIIAHQIENHDLARIEDNRYRRFSY